MRIEKSEKDTNKVKERSVTTSLEQEVIDQYYDYVEYGNELPVDAVYMTADDFGLKPAKVEMILKKYGVSESVEEKEKKGDKIEVLKESHFKMIQEKFFNLAVEAYERGGQNYVLDELQELFEYCTTQASYVGLQELGIICDNLADAIRSGKV